MAFLRRSLACALLALAGLLSGCFLDGGPLDTTSGGTESPGTGGGGAGTTTTTTEGSGAGGTGGATSMGGTGGMVTTTPGTPCTEEKDCPVPDTVCRARLCADGHCTTVAVNEGKTCDDPPSPTDACHLAMCHMGSCGVTVLTNTVIDDAKNGDCKKYICDQDGKIAAVPDNTDKPESSECTTGQCTNGNPQTIENSEGAACGPIDTGACCQGTCCYGAAGFECTAAGCCFNAKVCGSDCCSAFESCCNGECCTLCDLAGNCVF